MADIFISYSKQDQDEARLLAAFLEAEGYSVWWDTGLVSGENFRKTIMTELGRARAAIVIWTEHSIHSDWVQSEAGRAHADRKLIPVKAKGLAYKDIPPPFDNMHIESLSEREKILGAVVAQLAKPEAQQSAFTRLATKARFQLLSWIGIVGAVITLTANLQGLVTFAKWIRILIESWTTVLVFVWQKILFFLPKVYPSDALILTFTSFVAMNLLLCSRKGESGPRTVLPVLGVVGASLAILVVFGAGLLEVVSTGAKAPGDLVPGYYAEFARSIDRYLGISAYIVKHIDETPIPLAIAGVLYLLVFFAAAPVLPVVMLYVACRSFMRSFRLSSVALSHRLWRIVLGVVLVIFANYLSIWIEGQLWPSN